MGDMDLLLKNAREASALTEQLLPRVRALAALAGQKRADPVERSGVPEGWRVERDDSRLEAAFAIEVLFVLLEVEEPHGDLGDMVGDRRVTALSVAYEHGIGEWVVSPGSQSSAMDPVQCRARAAALLMAADECETRNAAGPPKGAKRYER